MAQSLFSEMASNSHSITIISKGTTTMPTNVDSASACVAKPSYDYWRKESHWQRTKRLRESERREQIGERQPRWQREQNLRQASRMGRIWQEEAWDEA